MLTQNYYNLLANILASGGSTTNSSKSLPVINAYGVPIRTAFTFGSDTYPYFHTSDLVPRITSYMNDAGIYIGTGRTPATKRDIKLESQIASGVSASISSTTRGALNGPFVEYKISVTNTGSSELTVREIGLVQKISNYACLLDRTVLDTPIVIQAGDAGIINYRLQADSSYIKSGIKIVPFTSGTDEEIATMIDAARQGAIDLQVDAGWRVGDYRTIHLDAWTGGGDTAHSAQDVDIIITQFGDYNNCGCLFQFDFKTNTVEPQRMNATATNSGGYGATEMYTTTLPAMVEALPSWLKTRLKTFDVLVSAGSQSSDIETVSGNKLALRSPYETDDQYGKSYAFPGEGDVVEFYKTNYNNYENRKKDYTGGSGQYGNYWYRSPYKNDSKAFVVYYNPSASSMKYDANETVRIAPFGCL